MFSTNFRKAFLAVALGFAAFTACVDEEFEAPQIEVPAPLPEDMATITIAELKALHADLSDQDTATIAEGTVLVGQIISSDKAGNIYKELYIQDQTGGILVRVDASALYNTYKLGQEIAIDCSQLVVGAYGGNKQLGIPSLYNDKPAAGRVPIAIFEQIVTLGEIKELELKIGTVEDIHNNLENYLGRLVKIGGLQVASNNAGMTFADAEGQITQNRYFNDGTSENDIIIRTSGYSDFAGTEIPSGKLDVTAIVSGFNGGAQLYINSLSDITLEDGSTPGEDDDDDNDDNGDNDSGEGNILFSEDFEDWTDGEISETSWVNSAEQGTVTWIKKDQKGQYAYASPYKSGDAVSEAWLVLPKVSNQTPFLKFDIAVGFIVDGHTDVMRLMVSNDFDGSNIGKATWEDITDQVTFPELGNSDADWWQWKTSNIDLKAFAGDFNVAFVYTGSDAQSTALELDNIIISDTKDGGSVGGGDDNEGEGDNNGDNNGGDNNGGNTGGLEDLDAYYSNAEGKSGYTLKTALHQIIKAGHDDQGYGALWSFYKNHSIDKYYENDGTILDIYSENPNGKDPYDYAPGSAQCGSYSGEGSCYNREHLMPKSWFDDRTPMVNDVHHIWASDGYVNGRRSNYPLGEVSSAKYTSENGSKLGESSNGTVFEPIDEFKGDLARVYFYMATRYEDKITSFSSSAFDGSKDQVYADWQLELFLKWHKQDPVSQFEIDRNNGAHEFQGNRNPFVDYPEFVELIWGN